MGLENEVTYYQEIYDRIEENHEVQKVSLMGNCRVWTRNVMLAMLNMEKEFELSIEVEAREARAELGLDHTFIKFSINNGVPYFYDAIGTPKTFPYFGPEKDAPPHLQKSRLDIIDQEVKRYYKK